MLLRVNSSISLAESPELAKLAQIIFGSCLMTDIPLGAFGEKPFMFQYLAVQFSRIVGGFVSFLVSKDRLIGQSRVGNNVPTSDMPRR